MPVVSILLPFHNAAATLDTAVESMLAQDSADLELLLIDNASTDDGPTKAKRWAARDPRVRLLQEPRLGIAHALNTGLAAARGTFIARMDADDVAHPDRLRLQVAYLDAHSDIGVVACATKFISTVPESRGMEAFVQWQNAILTPHAHYVKRFVDAPVAHPTVLFRRELVERYGGYDTGPVPEDHELWLRWMHAGVRFAKLPEPLLTWHDHADRLSRTHANYSTDAFFRIKAKWIMAWYARDRAGLPVIIAGTSALCQERAQWLEAEGLRIHAFTDVSGKPVAGRPFIRPQDLPPTGRAVVISLISQRGTGARIAEFLAGRGLEEGTDFLLAG